jgi:hypothetical protein
MSELLPSYQIGGINNVCTKCGDKISKPVNFYGIKSETQEWQSKAIAVQLRADGEKDKARRKKVLNKATKLLNWWWRITGK